MVLVTLIGEKIAEKDLEFIYLGPLDECKDCKLKNICFNLKLYHRYKITDIRTKRHSCSVHTGDVIVVEVEHLPIRTAIDRKYPKGSSTQVSPLTCDQIQCSYYESCVNPAVQKNKKYKIDEIFESIDCPQGLKLHLVDLTEV